jgi:hypothetical protein
MPWALKDTMTELFHTAIRKPPEVILNKFFSLHFCFQAVKGKWLHTIWSYNQWRHHPAAIHYRTIMRVEQHCTGMQDGNQMVLTIGLIREVHDPSGKSCSHI